MLSYGLKQAIKYLPKRKKTDSKYAGGKSLIIAGSQGMYGAAILAAKSCARVGSGFTYVLADKNFPVQKNPDFLTTSNYKRNIYNSYAVGPGLKDDRIIQQVLDFLFKNKIKNVVLDAEVLNFISKNKKTKLLSNWILTPHEGELARLLVVSCRLIKSNREKYIAMAQKKYGCIVILKGHKALVAMSKKMLRIKSGNSALAKAGTGDVLTGIITGLLSQNVEPEQAACLGVFIHGYIADQWIKSKKDPLSLMASDLIEELPAALYKIRRAKR